MICLKEREEFECEKDGWGFINRAKSEEHPIGE